MIEQLPEVWQKEWEKNEFSEPTLIQEKLFKLLATEQSVLGVSPTGSGKTLAYLLPLLLKLEKGEGNQLLIVLPSQELASQVATVARPWAQGLELKVQTIIGGANVRRQLEGLKKRPEIVIGTSGRILELIKARKIKAHQLKALVLDEIDDMVSQNEFTAAKGIIKTIQRETPIIGISATGLSVENELDEIFKTEVTIVDVTKEDDTKGKIEHAFILTPSRKRTEVLRRLAHTPDFKALVFFNSVSELGAVSERLNFLGVKHLTLASDQTQTERKASIQDFSEGKVSLLLTTDIGARGLDFSNLYYVVQYDVPLMTDDYVHRSGRVGRMGNEGMVLSLVNERELRNLRQMIRELNRELIEKHAAFGEIVSEKIALEEQEGPTKKIKKKTSENGSNNAKQAVSRTPDEKVKKKKKNRQKKQKNKGAKWKQ
ncbi:DEAD/DEAH box helicase [Vagococcus sp.]|uniref:DEAD/DEAH box helicase n=1 Tax=Vagococcus sp. TaxID=1933889 RepID=UPI003F96C9E1